jgi:dihydrofolate synthase/folylpolyglutamate synthase
MRSHPVLERLARFGLRLGLNRLESFLAWLGDPHKQLKCIHVAGTNGKGSVVRMVGSILQAEGRAVGEYTSPHLQRVNERIRINGVEVDDQTLSETLDWLHTQAEAWATENLGGEHPGDRVLTYFEMMTAAAFVLFSRSDLDLVVLEVGLGGRLDATNVVQPLVSAVCSISLDHMSQLGSTLEEIASEKAGIIKRGHPVIVGPLSEAALRVIRTIAVDKEAPIQVCDQDFRLSPRKDGRLLFRGTDIEITDLKIGLRGSHQVENAAVAIALVRALPAPASADSIREGLAQVSHPGRMEWLTDRVLVDCAHNGDGAGRLADHIRGLPKQSESRTLLLGMSEDKDARSILVPLAPLFDRVLTTQCAHPRALSAGALADQLIGINATILPSGRIEEALPQALEGRGMVVVAGSVFLAGAVRDIIGTK